MARRLTRNRKDGMLGGVAAGFADYFDVDPVLTRLCFVLTAFLNGLGLLFYIICWVIMPANEETSKEPNVERNGERNGDPNVEPGAGPEMDGEPSPAARVAEEVRTAGENVVNGIRRSAREPGRGNIIGGSILIVLGLMFLVDRFSWVFHWPHWLRFGNLWPLILIAIGVSMLVRSGQRERA